MNSNKAHLVVVMDTSGSMHSCAKDMEGSLRELVIKQRKEQGECTMSLYSFDTVVKHVFENTDIQMVDLNKVKLEPAGMTALFDAIGHAVVRTNRQIEGMQPKEVPGLVNLVIITDGMENSSKEFNASAVKELLKSQEQKEWAINFLGANLESFNQGRHFMPTMDNAAVYNKGNSKAVMDVCSSKLSAMRGAKMSGASYSTSYTDGEREQLG